MNKKEPQGIVKQSMLQSKMYYYLSSFTAEMHKEFRKYLESPYFNSDQVVLRFYDLFCHHILELEKDLSRREFWDLLYPEKPYKANRLRKVGSSLQTHIRGFLAQEILTNDEISQGIFYLRALNQFQFDRYFEHNYNKAGEKIEDEKSEILDPFRARFELEDESTLYRFRQPVRPKEKNYLAVVASLDEHLLLQKLKYGCLSKNYDLAIGTSHDFRLLEQILPFVEANEAEIPPLIAAYYYVYKGMDEPGEVEYYYKLTDILKRNSRKFVKSQALELYTFGLNYAVRKLNDGGLDFVSEIVGLYDDMLREEIILEKGKISVQNYKNITTMMCRLKEYDWTERFLKKYRKKILSDPDGAAFLYNSAVLEFHRGDFLQCYRLLQRFLMEDNAVKDEFYEIDVRRYLCISLYELREFDLLEFQINSFQNYLPRNKRISETSKRNYILFTRLLGRLLKTKFSSEEKAQKQLERLKVSLESAPATDLFKWLRTKVASEEKEKTPG